MVNTMATQAEKEELLNTFKSLDANGDGQLSRKELIDGLNHHAVFVLTIVLI